MIAFLFMEILFGSYAFLIDLFIVPFFSLVHSNLKKFFLKCIEYSYFMFESMIILVAQSYLTLFDSMTVACQDPLSMEFSRQEYWSG